ncbi:MAG: glycine cleavage system protein GcvH [Silvanigrellales bacterium]|jgi:glycine cleavage system H protein|nr:glycine cleavage system protein GcvH [Silvanigrellales bacterium]
MSYPDNCKYTKEHEWIRIDGSTGVIGVTKYAIEQLGDVVHLDLPKVGMKLKSHETFGTIESTKTVSDLYSPAAGTVVEVNASLADAPEAIADDPYSKGWLVKLTLDGAPAGLMSAAEYEKYVSEDSSH